VFESENNKKGEKNLKFAKIWNFAQNFGGKTMFN
jgi:hypothetical protein